MNAEQTLVMLMRGCLRRAREGAPYAPSFRARPAPHGLTPRQFYTLRALFLMHVGIYNARGWRPIHGPK